MGTLYAHGARQHRSDDWIWTDQHNLRRQIRQRRAEERVTPFEKFLRWLFVVLLWSVICVQAGMAVGRRAERDEALARVTQQLAAAQR